MSKGSWREAQQATIGGRLRVAEGGAVSVIGARGDDIELVRPVPRGTSGLLIDGGENTAIVAPGAFAAIAGASIDVTCTDSGDADGFYVEVSCPAGGAGLTDRVMAPVPAAYQDLSSGGAIDVVVDVVLPTDVTTPSCDLIMYLGNASDMANSLYRTFVYTLGGMSGALKPGRCILTTNVQGSSYQDTWSVNGSGTFSSPITHVAFRINNPTSGVLLKVREIRYRAIGLPGLILGFDDGHASVYWVYKLAAALGLRGVVPVVGSYVGLPSYMSLDQLRELRELGFTPINHSWSHVNLVSLGSVSAARGELEKNRSFMLSNDLGDCPIVAWPNGAYDDLTIQAAVDCGYRFARSAGKNQIRYLAGWGLENPFRLGSVDLGGKTLDTIKLYLLSLTSDEQCATGWVYGHQSTPGNPAGSGAAPADTLKWWAGWYRQLVQYAAGLASQGKLRPLSGQEFVNRMG